MYDYNCWNPRYTMVDDFLRFFAKAFWRNLSVAEDNEDVVVCVHGAVGYSRSSAGKP